MPCVGEEADRNDVRNSLNFNSVTPHSMCKQIQSLCSAKATGSDKKSACLLKTAAPQISDSLCYVINMSMKSGTVPKQGSYSNNEIKFQDIPVWMEDFSDSDVVHHTSVVINMLSSG